ncbi:AAA family ATPase [Opitutales bacterium]|nr:AAA family ATPase [Opitutales bacterium]MDA9589218.1 AAA family ATPase [Opitutales bacterium]MDB2310457.1 AAA family ATPase [Opitutales bacterium]MDB2506387.1 AAA family ATPase [Opitutales bacterium]
MYQDYFGFVEMPFHVTPNPRFLFLSPTHEEALQHLRYGIEEKKGFIVLTGEVGCGKTTLCRKLLEELDANDQCDTALLLNPKVSETQLLKGIMKELGEESRARSKSDLLDKMNDILLQRIELGREIVLIIDEAQNLSFDVLEMLRMLSNLETYDQKLLQIILMGQPELNIKLKEKRLRQLRQRVLVHYDLQPLNVAEVQLYIAHRLSLAGSNGQPQFTPRAMKKIAKASLGIPRMINNLCDKALLASYIRNGNNVSWWDARKALKDINRLHT